MNNLPIGILGGTFDPVHLGHIHLATSLYKICKLQKVVLIPCYQSPLRKPTVASPEDRFNMVQLAIKNFSYLSVNDYEIKHPTVSYTIQTLKQLRAENIFTPLALIIGIDAFNRFDEWHEWETILDLTHLLIANRPNYPKITNEKVLEILSPRQIFDPKQLQKKIAGLIYLADIKPLPIAATEIRTLIKQQKSVEHLVDQEVWRYINENKLYTK